MESKSIQNVGLVKPSSALRNCGDHGRLRAHRRVNPVIAELQTDHILVTALHSYMLTEQPRLFFMHFWAVGSPESVGGGIAAALKHVSAK